MWNNLTFADLIHPMSVDEFMTKHKGKKPLVVKASFLIIYITIEQYEGFSL